MKITTLGSVAVGIALAAGLAACNPESLTQQNQNPNVPTTAPLAPLFTHGTEVTVGQFLGGGINDLRGPEWTAQHLAEWQYPDEDRYLRLRASNTSGSFDFAYYTQLEDLHKVVVGGEAAQQPGVYGPALVMQTWTFGYLTNYWGDIPYTSALQGDSGVFTPKYDKQQDIYTSFFQLLTQASTDLDTASNILGGADPIYGGDPAKWQMFANSLHARDAMQIINVDPTTAAAELTAAFSAPGGLITDNANNATLAWPGGGNFDNPWSVNFQSRDDHRMSQTLMNIMNANDDPRIPVYAQPVTDTSLYNTANGTPSFGAGNYYGGMPNGLLNDSAGKYGHIASKPGTFAYQPTTPSYLMTAAEVLFIEAEAAERGIGGLPGTPQSYYNAAITASMNQWGITDPTTITAFLARPNVAYKGGTAGLAQIAVQKWIALYTDGGQAWAEWRRTCEPSTLQPGPAAIVNYVPRRWYYSLTEIATNADNVNAAVADQGGTDDFATRMWWDTKPTLAPTFTPTTTSGGVTTGCPAA